MVAHGVSTPVEDTSLAGTMAVAILAGMAGITARALTMAGTAATTAGTEATMVGTEAIGVILSTVGVTHIMVSDGDSASGLAGVHTRTGQHIRTATTTVPGLRFRITSATIRVTTATLVHVRTTDSKTATAYGLVRSLGGQYHART